MATKEKTFKKKLFKVVRELNVSQDRVVEFLEEQGYDDVLSGSGLNAKITDEEAYLVLREEYADDAEAAARVRELRQQQAGSGDGASHDDVQTLSEEKDEPEEPVPADADTEEADAEVDASTDGAADPDEATDAPEATEPETASPEAETDVVDEESDAPDVTDAPDALSDEAETTPEADLDAEAVSPEEAPSDEAAADEAAADDVSVDEEASDKAPVDEAPSEDLATEEGSTTDDTAADTADAAAEEAEADVAKPDAAPTEAQEKEASADADQAEPEAESADEPADAEAEIDAPSADAEDAETTGTTETSDEYTDTRPDGITTDDIATVEPLDPSDAGTIASAVAEAAARASEDDDKTLKANRYRLSGTKVVGKVDVNKLQRPKRKRKRKKKDKDKSKGKSDSKKSKEKKKKQKKKRRKKKKKKGPDEEDVEQTIQETLQELEQGASRERQRRRRRRRERHERERERRRERLKERENILEVTEFVTTGELANLMGESVQDVISTLLESGMMVSINQRLDRETIEFVVDEYGMEAEFIDEYSESAIEIEDDDPEDLEPRAPVVTVMGHVDHGKTSLLDYIRSANVVAGEEGGITQHIGAHYVELTEFEDEAITFLDTPGHEAFTAMRARGAKATDMVILVVAADDSVMPQTIEAINHAQAGNVPIVVAINKMDLPEADPDRVKAELAEHNVLVEEYGGDVQVAEVSAETGDGIDDLMEKVILQSEIMELQANPDREASGVIIESRLEKGRGNVITVLVQNGTLEVGDPFLAGMHSGSVRAMFDERDNRVEAVGPAQPALVLGCDGSPEVGDQFVVLDSEGEARDIAAERQRIHREQELRRKKQVSLNQVSQRMAEGDFQELNLIVKGDVGGSVEALSDALQKLKTEEVAVNIIHRGVGAITESDIMLARASDAVIIGFQVRPTSGARSAADREEVDIHTYSVIYDAIEDVRDALEGLLAPDTREETKGRAEVRETFKVPSVGMVAGSYVRDGSISRNDKIRVVRDGVVIYEGNIGSLKRFEDDVKEVQSGYECGISVANFNDVKVGDEFEAYKVIEEKRTLEV
jgi:translation initiation factor IF-2